MDEMEGKKITVAASGWVLETEWHSEMGINEHIHSIMAALDSI